MASTAAAGRRGEHRSQLDAVGEGHALPSARRRLFRDRRARTVEDGWLNVRCGRLPALLMLLPWAAPSRYNPVDKLRLQSHLPEPSRRTRSVTPTLAAALRGSSEAQQYAIRGIGLLASADDIGRIILTSRGGTQS